MDAHSAVGASSSLVGRKLAERIDSSVEAGKGAGPGGGGCFYRVTEGVAVWRSLAGVS